ncbi:MAG: 50S ribosomal protein L10 [Deferribacteraceae bacterium]|jgi:large subunit ribosomal protein L10|nr:50S ribosomal protein L10 [Deferribacteraceae bacterium]
MKKEQKVELAKGVADEITGAEGIIITSFKGLTFPQMDNIRRAVKSGGNDFRVIKNSLLKKALNSRNIDILDRFLTESTALVLVRKEFAAVAKDIKKYAKDYSQFTVKAGYLENKLLTKEEVIAIADLPSRDQLLAQLFATMNAPAQNFVSLLANIPRSLLNVLNAVKENKEK